MVLSEKDRLDKLHFYSEMFIKHKFKKINELTRTIDQKYHLELGQSLRDIRDLLAHVKGISYLILIFLLKI